MFFTGIPEIGFQSFDTFVVNEIKLDHFYGIIKTKGTIKNMNMKGFANTIIKNISGFDANLLEIHFKSSKLTFTGNYNVDAWIAFIPINAEGDFTLNYCKFNFKL